MLLRWYRGKEFTCQCRRQGSIPGLGRSPAEGSGNPPQYSSLGNPTAKGAWQAIIQGLAEELDMTEHTCTHNVEATQLGSIFSFSSVQFSSVAQSCPTLCDPMNHSTPGLPVHHRHPEFIQTHVHQVGDAIQPSHPLSSPSPPVPNPSQHQSLFH